MAGPRGPDGLLGWRKPMVPALRPGTFAAESGGQPPVKKLLLLVLVGVGALAVWRKVQSDRAELDLWTEATTSD